MNPGLCSTCRHVKRLESSRSSVFYMCTLADRDPNFPRYPRLPVLTCSGYEAGPENPDGIKEPPRAPTAPDS
jgi:hypothetical protein